jgi:hypothetical protein
MYHQLLQLHQLLNLRSIYIGGPQPVGNEEYSPVSSTCMINKMKINLKWLLTFMLL